MNVKLSNSSPIVSVENVSIKFGDFDAVKNIDFRVGKGEVVGLLGSNGAGKSSTMKAVAGIIKTTDGKISVSDLDLNNLSQSEKAKGLTGYCPDVGGLIVGATPREHIQLLLSLHKKSKLYPTALKLVEELGLSEFIDTPAGGFSHGMQRRLSVLLAALGAETVLVLDEPFDGVDPLGVEAINGVINEARAAGLAVLISTHLQPLLANVSDKIIVMSKGKILAIEDSKKYVGPAGVKRYRKVLKSL